MVARLLIILVLSVLSKSVSAELQPNQITLDDKQYKSLWGAMNDAKNGSIIRLGPGIHKQTGVLHKNNVRIEGVEGTKIRSKTSKGKGALVIIGNNTYIKNIECSGISVKDKNGACVRLEGKHLVLDTVYFHDSEQGLLTGSAPGKVSIINSRFENLGKAGRAHGIYVGGGRLYISNSRFLSSKDEGHEIKSRAKETVIENTVIASLGSRDSRLVDISNGGKLKIFDSVLQQGNKTSNWNLIGYGLEGYKYKENSIFLTGNMFIMDRKNGNEALRIKNSKVSPTIVNNAFIGKMHDSYDDSNYYFKDRAAANLEPYPFLPKVIK